VPDVIADRAGCEREPLGDLGVGEAFRDEGRDFALSGGQDGDGLAGAQTHVTTVVPG
jgi:hypothetical protein